MIRAGISGTNWTGKSCAIDQFVQRHANVKVNRVTLSEIARDCPWPMVEEQTLDASRWMVNQVRRMVTKPLEAHIQLFDRTPLDILAFTLFAQERAGVQDDDGVVAKVLELIDDFDYIFFASVTDEWPPKGVETPPLKRAFALLMDRYMQHATCEYRLNTIALPWDHEKRQGILTNHLCR